MSEPRCSRKFAVCQVGGKNTAKYLGLISFIKLGTFLFSEFASVIKAQVGSSSEIVYKDPVEDDPRRRRPDISLAKRVLKWEPKVELEVGIQKTIDYFKRELSRNHLTEKDSHEEIANYQNSSA